MKKLLIIALLSLSQIMLSQSKGTVKGVLTDEEMDNEPLAFANVFVKGTTIGGTTEMDGTYSFQVPVGEQTIVFSYVGYDTVEKKVTVVDGKTITLNQLMTSVGQMIDVVEIKTFAKKDTETAVLLDQKKATIIKESIGAVELSKKGVSNAAAATTKISGVAKSEGTGDIYIRGLGDRYLSTSMNGLPVPSDDVSNKNIDLGLFSTGIIEKVGISKTYATNSYADQGSGSVDVVSKKYSKKGFKVGFSGGTNTNVMNLDNFRQTVITDDVNFGFHNKKYALQDALTRQGWDTKSVSVPYNYGASLGASHKFNIGEESKLSFVLSSSYSSSNGYQEGLFRSYRANILNNGYSIPEDHKDATNPGLDTEQNDVEKYTRNINATGYAKVELKIDGNHKLSFNTLVVNKGTDMLYEQGRKGLGFAYDQDPQQLGAFVRDQNFKQTTLFVNQLAGEHKLNDDNKLSWAGGYNFVLSEEPNRIRNEVNILNYNSMTPSTEQIQYSHVGDFQQRKSSQKIEDNDYVGYIQNRLVLGSALEDEDKPYALNYGINFRKKQRSFRGLFVGVKAKNFTAPNIDNLTGTFTSANFDNGLDLKERSYDIYKADLLALAGFVNFDFKFDNKISGNLGLRFEQDDIDVNWDVANYNDKVTNTERVGDLNKVYHSLYPSVNLKYEVDEKNFLRFASSVTQTLPEFKELSPFEYVSPTGRVTKGNPKLEKSDVYNMDLKWEFFPSRSELVSATVFYKQIKNPINLAMASGSSGNFFYANTGGKATILGLELEGKVGLIKNEDEKTLLNATGNVTLMYLNQDLYNKFQYKDVTSTKLQGASNLIYNASLSYNTQTEKPLIATLTGNYSSDKIYALGSPEDLDNSDVLYNDEIIEKGFVTLDAVISKKITNFLTAKVVGKNLLNPEIKQTQLIREVNNGVEEFNDVTVQSYKSGMQLSLGLSLTF